MVSSSTLKNIYSNTQKAPAINRCLSEGVNYHSSLSLRLPDQAVTPDRDIHKKEEFYKCFRLPLQQLHDSILPFPNRKKRNYFSRFKNLLCAILQLSAVAFFPIFLATCTQFRSSMYRYRIILRIRLSSMELI